MKKRLFFALAAFVFAIAIYSLYISDSKSDLLMANIQALSGDEGGTGNCDFDTVRYSQSPDYIVCSGFGTLCCNRP